MVFAHDESDFPPWYKDIQDLFPFDYNDLYVILVDYAIFQLTFLSL